MASTSEKRRDQVRDSRVQKFCKAFYAALDRDSWGDIEPYLFEDIATGAERDRDTDALAAAVAEALDEYEKVK